MKSNPRARKVYRRAGGVSPLIFPVKTGGLRPSLAGVIFLLIPLAGCAAEKPAWSVAKTVQLKGLKVSLSKPVLVARSKGYLWFPTLIPLGKGRLLALMSNYADEHVKTSTSMVAWSRDGGLTWSKPTSAFYSDSHLRLKNGDRLLLPYYLYPRKEGMGAPYQLIPRGKQ